MEHKKTRKLIFVLSFITIGFIAFFIFTASYYRFPIGDDVLHQFTTSYELYTNAEHPSLGVQVLDFPTLFESVFLKYFHHSGRVVGYFLIPFLSIFGHLFISIFSVLIFIGVILLVVKNINFDDNPLIHPVSILLCFLVLFYFHPDIGWLLMWTFTSIYVASLLLLLLFITILRKILENTNRINITNLCLLNILGFIAGLTQEVFALTFLFVGFALILKTFVKKKTSKKVFLYLIGLTIGFILCFLAPGNFSRLAESHDSAPLAIPIITRFIESLNTHKLSITGYYFSFIILFPCFLLYCIQLYRRIKSRSTPEFEDILFVSSIVIIFVWAIFPYTPMYGTQGFLCLFLISVFIAFNKFKFGNFPNINQWNIFLYCGLIIASIFTLIKINQPWLNALQNTSIVWQNNIQAAIKKNETEVTVPKFPDLTSNRFTMKNYNNGSYFTTDKNGSVQEYETEYYKKYFKTKIIVY